MHYVDSHGVFVEMSKGVLYSAPANDTEPPTPDMGSYGEVTCVNAYSDLDGRNFLNRVNRLFATSFAVNDFAGR
jgi:hypothetical protein